MDDFEYIDSYFQGELLPGERINFERRMAEDKSFANDVALYFKILKAAKDRFVEKNTTQFIETLYQKETASNKVKLRRLWIGLAAAAVIIIAFIGVYWFTLQSSPQHIADQYIQNNLRTLSVQMDNKEDGMQAGLKFYNEGKLTAAAHQFDNIIQADTSNYTAKKYAGITYLRLGKYDQALMYFEQLENHIELYENPGKFYHALTLMKRNLPGDNEKARQLLQQVKQKGLEKKEDAEELLKKW